MGVRGSIDLPPAPPHAAAPAVEDVRDAESPQAGQVLGVALVTQPHVLGDLRGFVRYADGRVPAHDLQRLGHVLLLRDLFTPRPALVQVVVVAEKVAHITAEKTVRMG